MHISIKEAAQHIHNGGVVAIPTETVYGLAAALDQPNAINQVFELKGRPSNNPLIIHVPDVASVMKFVKKVPRDFELLVTAFWPGPLTVVLPVDTTKIPERARAGLPTAAFRVPNHSVALELLKLTGPLVMPSANLSGRPSATHPEHVEADFGSEFPVLDGGSCACGLESTIVHFNGERWQVIRQGAIAPEEFLPFFGYLPKVIQKVGSNPICPGQLYRHYAPKAKLTLSKSATLLKGVIVGFSDRAYPAAECVFSIGSSSKPEEVAEKLYAVLRQLDQENIEAATIDIQFPYSGLWATIHERLKKAAS